MQGDAEQIAERFWKNIFEELGSINSRISERNSYPENFGNVNIRLLKGVSLQIEALNKNFSEFMEMRGFHPVKSFSESRLTEAARKEAETRA